MKLNTKISLANLAFSICFFTLAGLGMYILINRIVYDELDNHLLQHKIDIVNQLQENPSSIQDLESLSGFGTYEWLTIRPLKAKEKMNDNFYTTIDTTHLGSLPKSNGFYRRITSTIAVQGQDYRLQIFEGVAAWDRISMKILFSVLFGLFVWVLLLYIFNQYMLKKIMTPFYQTVDHLEKISAPSHSHATFDESSTHEFNVLNRTLNALMERLESSFQKQKEFIQSASHEIQTPLSIIRHKTEGILAQSDDLDKKILKPVSQIHNTTVRLSRLSNELLLISRIDNRLFEMDETINVQHICKGVIDELHDFLAMKHIDIIADYRADIYVKANRHLMHSAIYNIIQNAIKFSEDYSTITVRTLDISAGQQLRILDQGSGIPPEELNLIFNRFKKGTAIHPVNGEKGTGLGLSIVQSICRLHGFSCSAQNNSTGATITISF